MAKCEKEEVEVDSYCLAKSRYDRLYDLASHAIESEFQEVEYKPKEYITNAGWDTKKIDQKKLESLSLSLDESDINDLVATIEERRRAGKIKFITKEDEKEVEGTPYKWKGDVGVGGELNILQDNAVSDYLSNLTARKVLEQVEIKESPHMLPIVKYEGANYFFDERLKQIRNIKNPHDYQDLNEFEMEYFQKAKKVSPSDIKG